MLTTSIRSIALAAFAGAVLSTAASANPLALFAPVGQPQMQPAPELTEPSEDATELPARFKRQVVDFRGGEAAGTVIIDTPNTYLYFVLGNGKALRYGIGVGREGVTW